MTKLTKQKRENISPRQGTFIDVFAGCGGLSLGLLQAGWKGLFAVENDENAFLTLKANLLSEQADFKYSWPRWLPKTRHNVTDILKNYAEKLAENAGRVDMLVGGPPCQGFSAAGRRNANDPRNKLVNAYLEFVRLIKPRIVLIENVRGITLDFEDKESASGKLNYASWLKDALSAEYNVNAQMLDTSLFGVPQRRQRYFVIAIRNDFVEGFKECPFKLIESMRPAFLRQKGILTIPVSSRSAISDLEVARNGTLPSSEHPGFEETCYKKPLTTYQKLMHAREDEVIHDTRLARHKPHITERFKTIIAECHSSGRLNISLARERRESLGLRKCALRVLDPENLAPTITSMPDDLLHYSEPRALTVRENARLQGFPDWFRFKGKYTTGGDRRRKEIPRFTQVANAVPPLVAEAIGIALATKLT